MRLYVVLYPDYFLPLFYEKESDHACSATVE